MDSVETEHLLNLYVEPCRIISGNLANQPDLSAFRDGSNFYFNLLLPAG